MHRIAFVHLGNVVHVHHRARHVLDRQVAELGDARRCAVEVDVVFEIADLFGADRGDHVLRSQRVGDVEAGQPARLQCSRVKIEHHLRCLAAEWPGDACALHRDQARAHEVHAEIRKILLGQALTRQRELNDRHGRGAVVQYQRRSRADRHLLQQALCNRGDLRVRGGYIDRGVKEDLDDAEGGIGIRFEMLNVVDGGRQRALEWSDDAPRHLLGRQPLVLKGHGNDRNIDAGENIHRHAQCSEGAEEQNEQGRHDERVGPAECDTDYGEHAGETR